MRIDNAECGIGNAEGGMGNERSGNGDLKERTKQFALRIIEFVEKLPKTNTTRVIGGQLLKSGTSVGANYRAACRARSMADFIAKMGIVEEEADECLYWMELLLAAGLVTIEDVSPLMDEANQILSIVVSSIKTAKKHKS
jgi:four helix bundle protein